MSSLFAQLGREEAVDTVVETFYRHVLSDDRISHFFDDINMDRQIAKQKSFLTMAFGGPVQYSGRDMRAAHAHLVARGMNEEHFNVVLELLAKSLKEHNVPDTLIGDVAGIADSVRDDVLGR